MCMMSNILESILYGSSFIEPALLFNTYKSVFYMAVYIMCLYYGCWWVALSVSDRSSWSVCVEMLSTPWLAYWSDSCPLTSGMEESLWIQILGQTPPPPLVTNQIIYTNSTQSKIVKFFCTVSLHMIHIEKKNFLCRHKNASMKLCRSFSICWTKM